MKCHMSWHWGLCYLALGQMKEAMAHYDSRLAQSYAAAGVFSMVDCIQFLLRIELLADARETVEGWEKARIAERWTPLANLAMQVASILPA